MEDLEEETEWSILEINNGEVSRSYRVAGRTEEVGHERIAATTISNDGAREPLSRSAPHILDRSRDATSPIVLSLSQKGVQERTRLVNSGNPPPLFMKDELVQLELHDDNGGVEGNLRAQLEMRRQVLQMSDEMGLNPQQMTMSDELSSEQQHSYAQEEGSVEIQEDLEECPLCLDDKPANEFVVLPCNHRYCDTCFDYYMKMETKKDEMIVIRCPDPQCRTEVPTSLLESIGAKKQLAALKKNERKKQRELDSMSRSGRSRGFLCLKLLLGTIRNGLFCGWFCPQDDGCAICWFLCSGFSCCCQCFCGYCCHAPCCYPVREKCSPLFDCYWLEDCPILNFTCWNNDIEYCPWCCSLVQYTGGCPNIHCRACGHHFVRDQQCNFPCYCCVYGFYVPLNYNVCFGEGRCCESTPNCWIQKI